MRVGGLALAGMAAGVCALLLAVGFASAHPAEAERIEILSRRIEAQPGDPRLWLARGAAYSHDGKHALAMADLRKAEQLGDPVVVAFELGLLRHRMGELALAKADLDRFLARYPGHARALEQRARVLADLGQREAAVSDYERIFAARSRSNPGLYLAAAKLLAGGGAEGIEPALAILDRGMQQLGVISQLQDYAIALELERGREDRALERLEALEPALGDGPEWQVQMAALLARVERPKAARRHLDRAQTQLVGLRETPARRALSQRIQDIESSLGAP